MSDTTISDTRDSDTRDSDTRDSETSEIGVGETATASETGGAEQLRLIDTSHLPLQHRLDLDTRRRGLAHVAEIRRLLAAQAARRAA